MNCHQPTLFPASKIQPFQPFHHFSPRASLLTLNNHFLIWRQFSTLVILDLGSPSMGNRMSLARDIQEHGLHGMSHCLAALPKREQPDRNRTAEEPEDADHDPA